MGDDDRQKECDVTGEPVYFKTHVWAVKTQNGFALGVSDYGLRELGTINYVEQAEKGKEYRKGDVFSVIETLKTSQELEMPCDGVCISDADNGLPDGQTIEDVLNSGHGHFKTIAEFSGQLDTHGAMTEEEYAEWVGGGCR